MAVQAILYSNPQWRFFTLTGVPATGCIFNAYRAANHAQRKTVWRNPERTVAWANPLTFDSTGAAGPFYFDNDEPYYLVITAADGSTVLYAQDNFPTDESGSPVVTEVDITNYILNPQFRLFPTQNYTSPVSASISTLAFGGWSFSKTNTTATDTLSFGEFVVGQTDVPNNPKYYLNYTCTGQGTGEITKDIIFTMDDVSTFALTELNLQLWGQSSTNSQIEVLINQHFGTGGSPSSDVLTPVQTVALTAAWGEVDPMIFTPPTVAGKTLGTNGDDCLQLILRMPLDTTCNVSLTNICLKVGDVVTDMQPITEEQAVSQVSPQLMALPNTVNPADGWYDKVLPQGSFNEIFISRAGKMIDWPINTAPDYALNCNGLQYFSADYYNLANACWDATQNEDITIGKLPWGTGTAGFVADIADAVTCTNTSNGAVSAASDVNSGYGVVQTVAGSASVPAVAVIFCRTGAQTSNGTYFLINSASTSFYVWFDLNNTGVNPAPVGKTAIEIDYTGTETAAQMAAKLIAGINTGISTAANTNCAQGTCFTNGSVTSIADNNTALKVVQMEIGGVSEPGIAGIVAVAGSSIVNGSYLTLESPSQEYYLWFSLNNKTFDPGRNLSALSGKKGIKVVYDGTETAAEMAELIATQWSLAQFRVPDVRGLFPRYRLAGATAVLPYPQQLKIASVGNDSGITFAIVGCGQDGSALSENLTGATAGNTVTSANAYAWITSITPSGNTASTMQAGIDGEALLPTPAKVSIRSTGDDTAVNFTLIGTDINGDPLTEVKAGGNNTTVYTVNTFTRVTSVTPSANTAAAVLVGSSSINGICLSQSGVMNTPLNINGSYSLVGGVAPSQNGTANAPLIINGVLARDPDYYARFAMYTNLNATFESALGDNTGSLQADDDGPHTHTVNNGSGFTVFTGGGSLAGAGGFGPEGLATDPPAGHETRPQNINFNKIIYI